MVRKKNELAEVQIEEDLPFQKREWVFERIGWGVLALIVGAALLGLLGRGPLSSTTAVCSDGSMQVSYDRFLHQNTRTALRITIAPESAPTDEVRIGLGSDYLDQTVIHQISPRPVREESGEGQRTFVFRSANPGQACSITFHIEPTQWGRLAGRLSLDNGAFLVLDQFVYP